MSNFKIRYGRGMLREKVSRKPYLIIGRWILRVEG